MNKEGSYLTHGHVGHFDWGETGSLHNKLRPGCSALAQTENEKCVFYLEINLKIKQKNTIAAELQKSVHFFLSLWSTVRV